MSFLLAVFVVVAFAAVLERLHLPDRAREVRDRANDALAVLRDPALSDARKERELQGHSVALFRLLGILVGGSALALALPLAVVWLLGQVGVSSFGAVLSVLERLDFLAAVTVAGLLGYLVYRKVSSA